MIKLAKDVKVGDVIRPWLDKTLTFRLKKEYTVTGEPIFADGDFSHYVIIPCINKKGLEDEVFIFCEEDIEVVEPKIKDFKNFNI